MTNMPFCHILWGASEGGCYTETDPRKAYLPPPAKLEEFVHEVWHASCWLSESKCCSFHSSYLNFGSTFALTAENLEPVTATAVVIVLDKRPFILIYSVGMIIMIQFACDMCDIELTFRSSFTTTI